MCTHTNTAPARLHHQLIAFVLVGILNTLFGYSVYALLIFAGLHYVLATLLSTIAGIAFNYKSIGVLVFKSHDNSRIIRFFLVYVLIYILNVSGLYVYKTFGFSNMYLGGLMLLVPLAVLSFLLNKYFVFQEK
jgi:putative flippase GtrA